MIRSFFQRRQSVYQCLTQVHQVSLRSICSKITQFDAGQKDVYFDAHFQVESTKFRNTLYPDSTDAVLNALKGCNSIQQVLDTFLANQQSLTGQHLCQAVLILRDIQKVFNKYYLNDIMMTPAHRYDTDIDQSDHGVFLSFQSEIMANATFQILLSEISAQCTTFDVEETVCTMLYLRFLGPELRHPTIQHLIAHMDSQLRTLPKDAFSYQTLSRYFSAFKYESSLYSVLHLSRVLPLVISQLESCEDIYSLGQVTVCLDITEDLMTHDLRCLFRSKLEHILNSLTVTTLEDTRSLLKVLVFLNAGFWSQENGPQIRRLLLCLANSLHLLDIKDMFNLQRIFSRQLEPHLFLECLKKQVQLIVNRGDNLRGEPSLAMLLCVAPVANHKQKKLIEKILLKKLQEPGNVLNTMPTLASISDLIRFLQTDNERIHSLLQDRMLVLLQHEPNIAFLIFFTNRYIKRYLSKANLRNFTLERFVSQSLMKETEYASPNDLSQYAGAVLKFCSNFVRSEIPSSLFNKLVNNVPQMNILSCFLLMDALNGALHYHAVENKQRMVSPQFSAQFTQLENKLESRLREILHTCEFVSMQDLFEILHMRKCKQWHYIYEKIYTKIRPEYISSKIIYAFCRHIVFSEPFAAHDVLHACVSYCESGPDIITGYIVSYVLYASYLNAYPLHVSHPAFLDIASSILMRDKHSLSALLVIRAALSLAYFSSLPQSLAMHIFSLPFLEVLDELLVENSSAATLRIRKDLMELNRAVCLDFAQYGIPWFHQKFAHQAALAEQWHIKSLDKMDKFRSDVYSVLVGYVGDRSRVTVNSVSPYGQKIDFVLCLDKQGNPLVQNESGPRRQMQTRLAILLDQTTGQGPRELRRRHLELQGYSVILLYRKHWNSLLMGDAKSKQMYLHQLFSQFRPLIASNEML